MKTKYLLYVVAGLLSHVSLAAEPGYDELYDKNGQLRPQYEQVMDLFKIRYQNQDDILLEESKKAFQGDNLMATMPRLLTEKEYNVVQKGVGQRARALQDFLIDYYSGKKKYLKSGLLTEDQVQRIIQRTGEQGYQGLIDPSRISFMYGPDIIRDSEGQWRVIEDNLGFLGGLGDLELAQKLALKRFPELKKEFIIRDSMHFYRTLADSYIARAKAYGGIPVILKIQHLAADNEDQRFTKIFEKLGVQTVTTQSMKRLQFKKDGVYLRSKTAFGESLTRVGYIYLLGEHSWMDPMHPASVLKNAMLGTPGLDPKVAPQNNGLVDAILTNKVGSSYTPGVDFVTDKEFYFSVDDLVKFYLKEEPILKNIESRRMANRDGSVSQRSYQYGLNHREDLVLKKVDGRGGSAVWVGPKTTDVEWAKAMRQAAQDPSMFILQKFTPLSTMDDLIVDLRLYAEVTPEKVFLTETPWGRGLPKSGNGKVNLSDSGREIAIMVVKPWSEIRTCRQVLGF